MPDRILLLSHAGVTLTMVGIMWSIQLLVYPQFRSVPAESFVPYVADHSTRIVRVLLPFAPLEVILALLLFVVRPGQISGTSALIGGLLLVVLWIATGFFYAPLHGELQAGGYDDGLVERLILSNWVRTVLWSVRGALALSYL